MARTESGTAEYAENAENAKGEAQEAKGPGTVAETPKGFKAFTGRLGSGNEEGAGVIPAPWGKMSGGVPPGGGYFIRSKLFLRICQSLRPLNLSVAFLLMPASLSFLVGLVVL
jgi:hypothetical protein